MSDIQARAAKLLEHEKAAEAHEFLAKHYSEK